jgi:hypothetical protein
MLFGNLEMKRKFRLFHLDAGKMYMFCIPKTLAKSFAIY